MASLAAIGNDLYWGKRSFPFVGKRKVWYTVALCVVAISLLLVATVGLKPGIEFSGGSEVTITALSNPKEGPANAVLRQQGLTNGARVTTTGSSSVRVQTPALDKAKLNKLSAGLAKAYNAKAADVNATTIGPTWGKDVTAKAVRGLLIFFVLVGGLIWAYFRTWKMAASALIALLHDVVITVGIYALSGFEVTPATVIGVLTILGYSLYDTVVVFDKVRDNTRDFTRQHRATYAELANLSINQTFVRSINTSVVGVLPVASILFVGAFILGAGTLRDISLTLFIGMIAGTLSSVFLATPMLVDLRGREKEIKEHDAKVLRERKAKREADGETVDGDDSADDTVYAAPLTPGHHLGVKAQPKKNRKRR